MTYSICPLTFRPANLTTLLLLLSILTVVMIAPTNSSADIIVKSGQKVAFLGDSLTGFGWSKPAGYVHLVVDGLAINGVQITPIPAGVGGNTSVDELARVNTDVISKSPDWVLISCGVNDAFVERKVTVQQYEANLTSIVDQCQAAHIGVILLTPTPVAEDWTTVVNVRLGVFSTFLKGLAAQKGCLLCDVNGAMMSAITNKSRPAYKFTVDNVHNDPAGDFVMATAILKTMGVTDDGIARARQQWLDIPDGVPVEVTVPMTPRQWFLLQDIAADQNTDVQNYLLNQLKSVVPPQKP